VRGSRHLHPLPAIPAEDGVRAVDDPGIALRVDVDAQRAAGNVGPVAAVPAVDLQAAAHIPTAREPHRAIGADADVPALGRAGRLLPRVAVISIDAALRVDHPGVALRVDVDAHGAAGDLVPVAAVPAVDAVAAPLGVGAYDPS